MGLNVSDFEISKGSGNPQYVSNDIAVIKVNDTAVDMSQLKSACLPTSGANPEAAVHSGWSTPPPFHFIQSQEMWILSIVIAKRV